MKEFFGQNFKTTLHGLAIFAVLIATWFSLIDKETAIWSIGILTASLGLTAGDGTNIKKVLVLVPLFFVLSSCTKSNFSSIFKDLGKEVPIQRVTYKIAKPQKDTTIIWYAPYGIFKNISAFKADTIDHSEEFNWEGLGDFIWDWNEKRKERRKSKKEIKNTPNPYPTPILKNDSKFYRRARDGLLYSYMGDRNEGLKQ